MCQVSSSASYNSQIDVNKKSTLLIIIEQLVTNIISKIYGKSKETCWFPPHKQKSLFEEREKKWSLVRKTKMQNLFQRRNEKRKILKPEPRKGTWVKKFSKIVPKVSKQRTTERMLHKNHLNFLCWKKNFALVRHTLETRMEQIQMGDHRFSKISRRFFIKLLVSNHLGCTKCKHKVKWLY